MRQAIHIFKKDVRSLRIEILLLLLLAALLGWAETHAPDAAGVAELLMVLAINYVIARVVHAEVIPGHNQFWITRPYRWKSLLGAKTLFILAFVNVPVFASQCYMIVAERFSFVASLPGLIWSQVLMLVCVSLPAMCLASLTAGLIPFLLAEFIVVGAVLIAEAIQVRLQSSAFLPAAQAGPAAVDWVRDSLILVLITCLAIYVLRWQYKTRRTEIGTKYAVGGAVAAAVIFMLMPWSFALAVQSGMSKEAFDSSSLNVALTSVARSAFPQRGRGRNPDPEGEVSLPLLISGVIGGRELAADALSFTIIASNGQTWSSGFIAPIMVEGGVAGDPRATIIDGVLHIDADFFEASSGRPVTVRVKLHLTSFGNPRSMTIPIQAEPVNVMDGLQCSAGLFNQLYCRSIFRWPRRRVYAKTGEGGVESYIRSVSYSPFPATLGFNPIEQHSFSGAMSATQATVTTKEPLTHFQLEREIPGVLLLDFTAAAKRRALTAPPPGSAVK